MAKGYSKRTQWFLINDLGEVIQTSLNVETLRHRAEELSYMGEHVAVVSRQELNDESEELSIANEGYV